MQRITITEMNKIVDLWCNDKDASPSGRFYAYDGAVWIGCDNTHKNCWCEEFGSEKDVVKWLNDEPVKDVNGHWHNEWGMEEN